MYKRTSQNVLSPRNFHKDYNHFGCSWLCSWLSSSGKDLPRIKKKNFLFEFSLACHKKYKKLSIRKGTYHRMSFDWLLPLVFIFLGRFLLHVIFLSTYCFVNFSRKFYCLCSNVFIEIGIAIHSSIKFRPRKKCKRFIWYVLRLNIVVCIIKSI